MTSLEIESIKKDQEEPVRISFDEFLETVPPNQTRLISNLVEDPYVMQGYSGLRGRLKLVELQLHCSNEKCNGQRFFRKTDEEKPIIFSFVNYFYLTFRCSNCRESIKIFSLGLWLSGKSDNDGYAFKLGEGPVFGPPTPARLITLIGPDREFFLKGRTCENQGLGVGAFTYYRRVVENQKNRIINEIKRVAERVNANKPTIEALESAISEKQFSKAIDMVKTAIPESLLIKGHNPLTLLHSALSDGIHGRTDEECLRTASSIRIVLAELSERIAMAMKDEAELGNAITNLLKK